MFLPVKHGTETVRLEQTGKVWYNCRKSKAGGAYQIEAFGNRQQKKRRREYDL